MYEINRTFYEGYEMFYEGYEMPLYSNTSNNINSESNTISNNKNTVLIFILSFYIFVLWSFYRLISYSNETEPTYESKSYNFTESNKNVTSFDNLKKVVGFRNC